MKKAGLHWTTHAQMARRGGINGTEILSAPEIDGFILCLRETEAQTQAAETEAPQTGGYGVENDIECFTKEVNLPPGLVAMTTDR